MIVESQEELLTAVFYLMWEHKPVDVADLAMRLLHYDHDPKPRDGGKLFFCRMGAQALLRDLREGRKQEDHDL